MACLRPFGVFIAGDAECRARDDQARADRMAHQEELAWARAAGSGSDGQTAFEGAFASFLGAGTSVLDTLVGSDPVSQLLSGGALGGAPAEPALDAGLLLAAVGVVGVVIFVSSRKGGK